MKEIINKMISLKVKIPIRETIFPTQKKCRQVRGNDKVVLHMWASGDFCQKCERPSPSPETMAKGLEWTHGKRGMSVVKEYLKHIFQQASDSHLTMRYSAQVESELQQCLPALPESKKE